ncbi:thiamine pyrophosphate-binding protein [Pseudomonadales bacterium]|nr:thiamine pyrophosphate-binding protein [Pseudomonadales bacterium]
MRGIDVFMDSLALHGVDTMFGNPGTTENPLLDSLIDHPDLKYYVTLHEGVAVGGSGILCSGKR